MDRGYSRGVQFDPTPSYLPYTRSRSTLEDILHDDIPSVVRLAAQQSSPYLTQYQDIYSQPTSTLQEPYVRAPQPTYIPDDLTFRMRPNTESVIKRDYSRYQPAWSWTDFATQNRQGSPYSGRDSYSRSTDYPSTLYKPVFNQYLTADYQPAPYKPKPALFTERESTKERTPFFLQPILPRFGYNPNRRERDIPASISSHANSSFPFRKYRSDFVPYAPYKSLHDSAKYTPNPDWLSFRPWGYKFRKARYVYVPEEENSSKSVEIERIMREARLRELVKGVYSTSYGDSVTAKVTGKLAECKGNTEDLTIGSHRSVEAETAVTQVEAERRKPLTAAEKRKRNETLAIGISRTELLKNTGSSDIGIEVPKSDVLTNKYEKESYCLPKAPTSTPKEPTPPPKKPAPPPKEPTPPPKEPTPPPKESTPPPKEPTPPPKEPSPPPRVTTPPPKDPTPPPKEPTPPPKEPTPPPKEPTPPPKEPTPPPKEQTPPPKEPTPPPKEASPPSEEVTPPPIEQNPASEKSASPPKESTPTPEETNHIMNEGSESLADSKDCVDIPNNLDKEEVNPMLEESIQIPITHYSSLNVSANNEPKDTSPCEYVNNQDGSEVVNGNEESLNVQEINIPVTYDNDQVEENEDESHVISCGESAKLGGVSEASNLDYETEDDQKKNVLVEEVCDTDGVTVQTEYIIEEVEVDEEELEEV